MTEQTKQRLGAAGALTVLILLMFGIGYGTGRMSTPIKTIVQEKLRVETVEKQVVVEKVKTEVKVVYVKDTQKDTHTETVTEKKVDGTVVTKVVEDSHVKTEVKNNTDLNTVKDKSETSEKHETVDKSKTVITERDGHNWSLAIQPGFDVAGALGKGTYNMLDSLPLKHVVAGVSIERRLVGPIFGGLWANSQGSGGLSFRLEF